jgi:hypothetical protein
MSSTIHPAAAQPSGTQSFEQSDRNPPVNNWGGTESDGGQVPAPSSTESRVTQASPGPAATAGLVNYDIGDSTDSVEDTAEQEG